MSISDAPDPDDPADVPWSHVRMDRPDGRESRASIDLWKRLESVVVLAGNPAGMVEEARTGRMEGQGFVLRERDYSVPAQYLRLNTPRRLALNRVFEHFYRQVPFDCDVASAIERPEGWADEAERIARQVNDLWRVSAIGMDRPPRTSTVSGWHWEEIRHLDEEAVRRAVGTSLPQYAANLPRRNAFLRLSDSEPEPSIHVIWGEGSNDVEMVISSPPTRERSDGSEWIFHEQKEMYQSSGLARTVTVFAPATMVAQGLLDELSISELSQLDGPIFFRADQERSYIR